MDKTLAGVIGAVSALAISAPSHAASLGPQDVDAALSAASYADLLQPIPNAPELLKIADAKNPDEDRFDPNAVETVQYHHHHHHHHHHWRRRWWHRHHRPVVVITPPG